MEVPIGLAAIALVSACLFFAVVALCRRDNFTIGALGINFSYQVANAAP